MLLWGALIAAACAAPLRLAVSNTIYAAPVLIAEAEGYFRQEGLNIDIKHFSIGRICLQELLAGRADFATAADAAIMFSAFSRKDFRIVATTTISGRENQMVVRSDRGINTAADLRGKRIGVLVGTAGHYFADTFLIYHGLTSADVVEVPLDPADPDGPIVRGEVDAAALFGHDVSSARKKLGATGKILHAPNIFNVTFNVLVRFQNGSVKDDDIVKLLRAIDRAQALIRRDPERALQITAKTMKIPASDLRESWADFDFQSGLAQSLISNLESEARWAIRNKLVPPESEMPDFLELLHTEPLKRAKPRAVRLMK